jgi:tetratricopeptide (TPR) repeat protein
VARIRLAPESLRSAPSDFSTPEQQRPAVDSHEVDSGPDSFDDVAGRAFDLYLADQPRKAIAMADYAAALRPDSEYPHRIKAISYRRLRRPNKALESAMVAVKLAEDEPLLHSLLADLYLDLNDLPHALESAARAVRLGPDSAEAHSSLAAVQLISQRYSEAEASIARALELRPDLPEALEIQRAALLHRRSFGAAFAEMRQAATGLERVERSWAFLALIDTFLRGGPPPDPNELIGFPRFGVGRRSVLGSLVLLSYPFVRLSSFLERNRNLRLLPPDIREHIPKARSHPAIRRERRLARLTTVGVVALGIAAFIVFYGYVVPRP